MFFNRWVGLHVGGTETHIKELASRLAKRGHEVHILTMEGNELKAYCPWVKLWYVSRNFRERLYSRSIEEDPWVLIYGIVSGIKFFFKLLEFRLRGIKYDVVSVHCSLEAFLMFILRTLFHLPYVFVFEGYTSLEGKLAKYANAQIAISQTVVDNCYKEYSYKPIAIPVGIDCEKFNPVKSRIHKSAITNSFLEKKLVLTVGRLVPTKNIPTLLYAAKLVCEKDPTFIFLIVGEGREKERIQRIIRDFELQNNVIMTGKVSDEMLATYYRSADLFVSPENVSWSGDQFLITFLESMSSGLPVIWTSDLAEIHKAENWGVFVPPERPDLLAEKILEIANNEELKQNLIKKGLDISKKYDWNRLIVQYEKVYVSVIEKPARRAH